MILGLAPGVVIGMQRLELATDDELVLCTDGVTEARAWSSSGSGTPRQRAGITGGEVDEYPVDEGGRGTHGVTVPEYDDVSSLLRAVTAAEGGTVHVHLEGRLAPDTAPDAAAHLARLLQGYDRVVVDLDDLRVERLSLLAVLARAARDAGGWPEARLALVARDGQLRRMLRAAGVADRVAVADEADLALDRAERRPAVVDATWTFPGEPEMVGRARRAVDRRLAAWAYPGDPEDVALVVNELAANAVEHAKTPFAVTVTLDRDGLRVAVGDRSPLPPVLRPHDPGAARGRGLQLVDSLAAAWSVDDRGAGKIVWALLTPDRG
jgi:anti-sigma regulatory factor (Ser/Thr protein kinase)